MELPGLVDFQLVQLLDTLAFLDFLPVAGTRVSRLHPGLVGTQLSVDIRVTAEVLDSLDSVVFRVSPGTQDSVDILVNLGTAGSLEKVGTQDFLLRVLGQVDIQGFAA